jgi:hypothetical protein
MSPTLIRSSCSWGAHTASRSGKPLAGECFSERVPRWLPPSGAVLARKDAESGELAAKSLGVLAYWVPRSE